MHNENRALDHKQGSTSIFAVLAVLTFLCFVTVTVLQVMEFMHYRVAFPTPV